VKLTPEELRSRLDAVAHEARPGDEAASEPGGDRVERRDAETGTGTRTRGGQA
jgi:hypothetical protein